MSSKLLVPPPSANKVTVTVGPDRVKFDSSFDSGNASFVELVEDEESKAKVYQVWVGHDCSGSPQVSPFRGWFHFSVSNIRKGQKLNFVVRNLARLERMFRNPGRMKPVYFSVLEDVGWRRIATPITFKMDLELNSVKTTEDTRPPYQLSWSHRVESDFDTLYFALCYPLSYENMRSHVTDLIVAVEEASEAPQKALTPLLPLVHGIQGQLLCGPPNARRHRVGRDAICEREELCMSIEGRSIDLLTISSKLTPTFAKKKVVFLSARVHPGEVPGQWACLGALHFLLSSDPRACVLRQFLEFKVVPIINPDGVVRGHYRTNATGLNLNRWAQVDTMVFYLVIEDPEGCFRFYDNPSPKEHEAVSAIVSLLESISNEGRLLAYIDMHGHANETGCFLYGNALQEEKGMAEQKLWNLAFPKLVCLNSPHMDIDKCQFSEEGVSAIQRQKEREKEARGGKGKGKAKLWKERVDSEDEQIDDSEGESGAQAESPVGELQVTAPPNKLSKDGSGRVGIFRRTGAIHCYTLECSYMRASVARSVALPKDADMTKGDADLLCGEAARSSKISASPLHGLTPKDWAQVGEAVCVAVLDLYGVNPWSRLPNSHYKSLTGMFRTIEAKKTSGAGGVGLIKYRRFSKDGKEVERKVSVDPTARKKPPTLSTVASLEKEGDLAREPSSASLSEKTKKKKSKEREKEKGGKNGVDAGGIPEKKGKNDFRKEAENSSSGLVDTSAPLDKSKSTSKEEKTTDKASRKLIGLASDDRGSFLKSKMSSSVFVTPSTEEEVSLKEGKLEGAGKTKSFLRTSVGFFRGSGSKDLPASDLKQKSKKSREGYFGLPTTVEPVFGGGGADHKKDGKEPGKSEKIRKDKDSEKESGKGSFPRPRTPTPLGKSSKLPIAGKAGEGHTLNSSVVDHVEGGKTNTKKMSPPVKIDSFSARQSSRIMVELSKQYGLDDSNNVLGFPIPSEAPRLVETRTRWRSRSLKNAHVSSLLSSLPRASTAGEEGGKLKGGPGEHGEEQTKGNKAKWEKWAYATWQSGGRKTIEGVEAPVLEGLLVDREKILRRSGSKTKKGFKPDLVVSVGTENGEGADTSLLPKRVRGKKKLEEERTKKEEGRLGSLKGAKQICSNMFELYSGFD